jgi:putative Mg2+ transporter-C (MgtC) family protein
MIAGLNLAGENADVVTRVIQGIAAGIGFLGAGTILKLDKKQEIKGLTTASSIWLAAALGTAAGLAEYALAVAAACVSLFVLAVLGPIEKLFEHRQAKNRQQRDQYDKVKTERKKEEDV